MGLRERPILITELPGYNHCETFGPYAAANTGSNLFVRLPFNPSAGNLDDSKPTRRKRYLVIDRITARAGTPSSATASIAIAYNGTTTTLVGTGAIAAANAVTNSVSVKSDAQTADTDFELPLKTDPATNACNKFPLDDPFALYLYSTASASSLADLTITIWYRIDETQ